MEDGRKILIGLVAGLAFFGFVLIGYSSADDIKDMKKQIEVLSEEIEKLKLGAAAEPKYESFMGLGPAASKVYTAGKGLSLGGYGEILYQNFMSSSKKDQAEVKRFVLYGGYKFDDWIVMNTELEFEGVSEEISVEFSYLDFLLNKNFNLRTGLMLMPIGFLNEFHEPTVYHGVLRPDVETNIIPSTWREIGIMAYGDLGQLKYNLAFVNGLRLKTSTTNIDGGSWIRNGRQQGGPDVNADAGAAIVRLDYEPTTNLQMGGTYYLGKAVQEVGKEEVVAYEQDAEVRLWEIHTQYQIAGLHLRGLFTQGSLNGNSAMEAAPPGNVGKKVQGWYAEAAYDVLPIIRSGSEMSLTPFVRYEKYDTHKEVFIGDRDPTLDRTVTTIGLGFKPHPNVVIKADFQSRDTKSALPTGKGTGLDENKIDQLNIGIGFIF